MFAALFGRGTSDRNTVAWDRAEAIIGAADNRVFGRLP
jgi:hypothetical protein